MKNILLLPLLLSGFYGSAQQSYKDSILHHIKHYKQEFITDSHSPLKAADTGFLEFYEPDVTYRVTARLDLTSNAQDFQMPTHSGKTKTYRQYGVLRFKIHDTLVSLNVYQGIDLIKKDTKFKKYLFVPFTDQTTYTETYGGGRYIDLSTDDLKNSLITVDFNKCYNPYCAYAEGYSCPIPPAENRLPVAIKAGEKLFAKPSVE